MVSEEKSSSSSECISILVCKVFKYLFYYINLYILIDVLIDISINGDGGNGNKKQI